MLAHRWMIMSDGSDVLRFLDPDTFTERRRIHVTSRGQPLRNLNELEYVDGGTLAHALAGRQALS